MPDATIGDIEIITPCLFRRWLVQRSRCSGIGQCTEEGQHHADAPVESWFNAHKVHRESITRLGSLDIEWAGLRVKVPEIQLDRKSTRLNSSHVAISYAVFCLKKNKHQ